jgi:MoaA/NifB/PqqE/SkfB family radical SAM enzyme
MGVVIKMNMIHIIPRIGKNLVHYLRHTPAMFMTNILLTHKCTQACLQCTIPLQESDPPYIPVDCFKFIIDRLAQYGTQVVNLTGGEPLLHPRLAEIFQLIKEKKFARVQLLSNFYASESTIDHIIDLLLKYKISLSCSFDGLGEVADKLRGAHNVAGVVMRGLEKLDEQNRKMGKPILTAVNIVINQQNLCQVPDIIGYIERLGWKAYLDIYRWSSSNHNEVESLKIKDFDQLNQVLALAKKSPAVLTPRWLLDGYINYLNDDYPKKCPYLDSPAFGSKFFIHPNGDVRVCIGDAIGNLLKQSPSEIFFSEKWHKLKEDFKTCRGCWNACYTPFSSIANFFKIDGLKTYYKTMMKK